MTEEEWLKADSPEDIFEFVCRNSSLRKGRLFSVACCRRIEHGLTHPVSNRAIELSELYADKQVQFARLKNVYSEVPNSANSTDDCQLAFFCTRNGKVESPLAVAGIARAIAVTQCQTDSEAEAAAQARIVRDIFGNPFRPVSFNPHWRTSDVVNVARGIYEEKAFERMPILADALMDAGCDDEQIIGHSRGEGQHVRGCWVVDLVLGKQ